MNYSFEDYEKGVLNALADLKRENSGGYLAALEGYAGQLDTLTAIKTWAGRFPAVAVAVPSAVYVDEARNNVYWQEKAKVLVFIGAQSWRGQAAARGGVTGAQTIVKDVRSRLLNKNLGLEIRGLIPQAAGVLASEQNIVIYVAEYQIINDRILEE